MAKEEKILNEEQMRKYVEDEVRKTLMESGYVDENGQLNEGLLNLEGIIGAILGHNFIPKLLTKLLNSIGIPTDQALGQWILKRVGEVGGYAIGSWIDKNWDPIGIDNLWRGRTPQSQAPARN